MTVIKVFAQIDVHLISNTKYLLFMLCNVLWSRTETKGTHKALEWNETIKQTPKKSQKLTALSSKMNLDLGGFLRNDRFMGYQSHLFLAPMKDENFIAVVLR
jgi:hypothetical protein